MRQPKRQKTEAQTAACGGTRGGGTATIRHYICTPREAITMRIVSCGLRPTVSATSEVLVPQEIQPFPFPLYSDRFQFGALTPLNSVFEKYLISVPSAYAMKLGIRKIHQSFIFSNPLPPPGTTCLLLQKAVVCSWGTFCTEVF